MCVLVRVGYMFDKPVSRVFLKNLSLGIAGSVVVADTGNPVPDAMISIEDTRIALKTDESGFFSIGDLPEGNYKLSISAAGFHAVSKNIRLTEYLTDLKVSLERALVSDEK